jgi:nucleotide-binding universal stress UspA family protein
MFRHLLVPLDGSHFAQKALPAALELAERFGSKVTVMRVVAPAKSMLALQRGYAAAFGQLAELASQRPARTRAGSVARHHLPMTAPAHQRGTTGCASFSSGRWSWPSAGW